MNWTVRKVRHGEFAGWWNVRRDGYLMGRFATGALANSAVHADVTEQARRQAKEWAELGTPGAGPYPLPSIPPVAVAPEGVTDVRRQHADDAASPRAENLGAVLAQAGTSGVDADAVVRRPQHGDGHGQQAEADADGQHQGDTFGGIVAGWRLSWSNALAAWLVRVGLLRLWGHLSSMRHRRA